MQEAADNLNASLTNNHILSIGSISKVTFSCVSIMAFRTSTRRRVR